MIKTALFLLTIFISTGAQAQNLVANGGNRIHGSVQFTYNGTLGATFTEVAVVSGPTTYVNNVSGWMEQ